MWTGVRIVPNVLGLFGECAQTEPRAVGTSKEIRAQSGRLFGVSACALAFDLTKTAKQHVLCTTTEDSDFRNSILLLFFEVVLVVRLCSLG